MFNTYDPTRPYDNQMGYLETVLDRFWSKVKFEYNEDGTINVLDIVQIVNTILNNN